MVFSMWFEAFVEWIKFLGLSWFTRMRSVLTQVLTLVVVFLVILWISVFLYGSFYYAYMPQIAHERDVNLEFSTDCEHYDRGDRFCSFPAANFTLTKPNQGELLTQGQSYVVSLELEMPESAVNQHHGMFMVRMEFYSQRGEVTRAARRSGMLRYKSWLLQAVETLLLLPPLLVGSSEQRQTVAVEMFTDYQEDPYKPALGVSIKVESKKVEIYSTKMRIHARFTGLRYFLFTWPLLSAFLGVSLNMFFLCIVAMLSWYQLSPAGRGAEEEAPPAGRIPYEERQKRVRALLDRERQKERDALKRELGLAGTASSPDLSDLVHRRSASASSFKPDTLTADSDDSEGSLRQRHVTSS